VEKIRQQWEQSGWGENYDPDVSFEKQRDDDEYRKNFEGKEGQIQLADSVSYRRNAVETPLSDKEGHYTLRATLRGTWDRVKLRITGNVGWGYDGCTPDFSQRRKIIAEASSNHLWSRIPVQYDDLPHTQGGLLIPPMLDDNGVPIITAPPPSRRTLFPFASREFQGNYSPPELKNPPNTIKAFPSITSRTTLASVKNLFTALRGRSGQSFTVDSRQASKQNRFHSDQAQLDQGQHAHDDGSRCALMEPQYLPPPTVRPGITSQLDTSEPLLASEQLECTPYMASVTVQRKTTQIQVKQISNDPIHLSVMSHQDDDADPYTMMPTSSILRDKSKRSFALSRSSTVRFMDPSDNGDATTTLPSYSPGAASEYSQASEVIDRESQLVNQFESRLPLPDTRVTLGEKCMHESQERTFDDRPSLTSEVAEKPTKRSQPARDTKWASSKKSSRSYTESVNFGDDDDNFESSRGSRAKDSRFLARSKTIKKSLAALRLDEETIRDDLLLEEEVVMDLTQCCYEAVGEPSPGSQLSAFYNAYYSDEEENDGIGEGERDVEDDIESALLSLIGTSKSSPYDTSPDIDIDIETTPMTITSPTLLTPRTPIGEKKTWQERNGKWQRLVENEVQGRDEDLSPLKTISHAASPPPLPPPPPPPSATAWKEVLSPARLHSPRFDSPLASRRLPEADRETQFAMDRVQSIVAKSNAKRQQPS
jgi:hypothetical protein